MEDAAEEAIFDAFGDFILFLQAHDGGKAESQRAIDVAVNRTRRECLFTLPEERF